MLSMMQDNERFVHFGNSVKGFAFTAVTIKLVAIKVKSLFIIKPHSYTFLYHQ